MNTSENFINNAVIRLAKKADPTKVSPAKAEYKLDMGISDEEADRMTGIYNSIKVEKVGMDAFPEELFNDVLDWLLSEGKYRDTLMMVCAANFGMRFSDVRQIKVCNLVDVNGEFRTKFYINEQKTTKTRPFYINEAVKVAMVLYWEHYGNTKGYNDYLFTSDSNHKTYTDDGVQTPISHTQMENSLKTTIKNVGVKLKNDKSETGGDIKLNTHSFRKLYGGKFCRVCSRLIHDGILDVDLFAIQLLQLDFSHTSMSTTQRYCGEMERAKAIVVNNMNIGLDVLEKYLY